MNHFCKDCHILLNDWPMNCMEYKWKRCNVCGFTLNVEKDRVNDSSGRNINDKGPRVPTNGSLGGEPKRPPDSSE